MKNIIYFMVLSLLFSCDSNVENNSVLKLESFSEFSEEFNTEDIDNIVIIPIEMGCEYCVLKIVEFLRVFNVADNSRVILTASSKASLKIFLDEHVLHKVKNLHLDNNNYFFNKGLSFLNPVLYVKNILGWNKTELYPINIEDHLFSLFVQNSNQNVAKSFYYLKIEGQISNSNKIDSTNSLKVIFLDSFGFDSLYNLDFPLENIFLNKKLEGMIIQKEEKSFYYYTYDVLDSTSAKIKRNLPNF